MEWLEPEVKTIKRNLLSGGLYEDIDSFKEEIDKLKTRLIEQGPKCQKGKMEIFADIQLTLISKATEYMQISAKQQSEQTLKIVQEKLKDLQILHTDSKEENR